MLLIPQDIDLIPSCPSFVAACVIYATRAAFHPRPHRHRQEGAPPPRPPPWPQRLYTFTGHSPMEKKFRQVRFTYSPIRLMDHWLNI